MVLGASKQTQLLIYFVISSFFLSSFYFNLRKVIYKFFRRTPDIGTAAVCRDVWGPAEPANAGKDVPTNANAMNVFETHFCSLIVNCVIIS